MSKLEVIAVIIGSSETLGDLIGEKTDFLSCVQMIHFLNIYPTVLAT
jgi:hypothetical protein